jgi:hypothetical protein
VRLSGFGDSWEGFLVAVMSQKYLQLIHVYTFGIIKMLHLDGSIPSEALTLQELVLRGLLKSLSGSSKFLIGSLLKITY